MHEKTLFKLLILGIIFPTAYGLFPQIGIAPTSGQSTTSTVNTSITISDGSTTGGGTGPNTNPADVDFSGYTSPNAVVTIVSSGATIGTVSADSSGSFLKNVRVDSGFTTFEIQSKDTEGRSSSVSKIIIGLKPGSKTQISNIFLSPTIQASRELAEKGMKLRIFGSTYPGSDVRIFNNNTSLSIEAMVKADSSGNWEYPLDTTRLSKGSYSYKVNAQFIEPPKVIPVVSDFSESVEFSIDTITCNGADFNTDGGVNIADFSIMLFYWGPLRNPATLTNICVDLNKDEHVNIFDFSVLMYEWTG